MKGHESKRFQGRSAEGNVSAHLRPTGPAAGAAEGRRARPRGGWRWPGPEQEAEGGLLLVFSSEGAVTGRRDEALHGARR